MNKQMMSLLFLPLCCLAESVVPIAKVESDVNIRLMPDASSDIVGKLFQGSFVELVATENGWYEVQLEGDATGYISADWTRVVSDEVDEDVSEAVIEDVVEDVAEE